MRANTKVWWLLESVGRPDHTRKGNGTIRDVTLTIAAWLLEVPMGHNIRIKLARDESELHDRRSAARGDLMSELESILGGEDGLTQE